MGYWDEVDAPLIELFMLRMSTYATLTMVREQANGSLLFALCSLPSFCPHHVNEAGANRVCFGLCPPLSGCLLTGIFSSSTGLSVCSLARW